MIRANGLQDILQNCLYKLFQNVRQILFLIYSNNIFVTKSRIFHRVGYLKYISLQILARLFLDTNTRILCK